MPARPATIRSKLLEWYAKHGRHSLPWRKTKNPYRILVSELMLQQTQVDRVIPFYRNWLKHFPTLKALANATEAEALQAWKGLGYYRRAKSLYRLALDMAEHKSFTLPKTRKELEALPGIGPYTAGALLSFAHDLPEAALDTNIMRVITRVFGCAEKDAEAFVHKLFKDASPHDINSALMDLGASHCSAKSPSCDQCPLQKHCVAFKSGNILAEASNNRSRPTPNVKAEVAVAAFREGRKVFIARKQAVLSTSLGNKSARAQLQDTALQRFGVEIAVRPACARGTYHGKPASFHRCTLLYGKLDRFKEATRQQLNALPADQREALQIMKLF